MVRYKKPCDYDLTKKEGEENSHFRISPNTATQVMGMLQPITELHFVLEIKARDFAK